MITFIEALSWLNKFEDTGSYLNEFEIRIITQLEIAYENQEFEKVRLFIDLLSTTPKDLELDTYGRAEISIRISRYEYYLENYERAASLIREGLQQYAPLNSHNVGVAQWLLGCVFLQIPKKQSQAIQCWKRSIDIFRSLSRINASEKAEWYNRVTNQMEDSVLRAIELS